MKEEKSEANMDSSKIIDFNHQEMVSKLMKDPRAVMHSLDGIQGLKKLDLLHGTMGLSGESGEFLDAVKKHVFYNRPIDMKNAIEELGDIEFYLEAIRKNLGITREQTLTANMDKLAERYSNFEYSDEKAHQRADKS